MYLILIILSLMNDISLCMFIHIAEGLPTDYSTVWIAAIIMFGEYLLFLFLAAVASNLLMYESHSMPNEDDLADDVDMGPSIVAVTINNNNNNNNKVLPFNGNSDSLLDTKIFEKDKSAVEAKIDDPKIIELPFEPIAFAFQNIQYKVKVNDGSLFLSSHQTIFKLMNASFTVVYNLALNSVTSTAA